MSNRVCHFKLGIVPSCLFSRIGRTSAHEFPLWERCSTSTSATRIIGSCFFLELQYIISNYFILSFFARPTVVLLGDTAVGKSCLVVRFVRDEFFEFQEPTIGAAFLTQTVSLDDATVKFEIWDTAGQERYRSLAPMYYRGAAAAIVVYDITNKDSFNGAKSWVKELQRRGDPNVIIALVRFSEFGAWFIHNFIHFIWNIIILFLRLGTKLISSPDVKLNLKRRTLTLKKMAYFILKHLQRMRTMWRNFLW